MHQLRGIHGMDQLCGAHQELCFVLLQVPDKVQRAALIRTLGIFLLKLLHPVFAADVYPGRNGLAYPLGIIHFGSSQQQDFLFVSAGLSGGLCHLLPDSSYTISYLTQFHCPFSALYRFCLYSIPQKSENFHPCFLI